tara:strand:- start:103 stop:1008 length:906 start_codon:yes stop_codon:yes gene_type:complete
VDPIVNVPNITVDNSTIPYVQVNGTGIKFIGTKEIKNNSIQPVGIRRIADGRIWLKDVPQAIPIAVPVTEIVGTPIVDMPGCVQVHKENAKNPKNKNKMLVDDDPKGNTVLCDAGAPYFYAPNYDARELSWQTIYQPQEEAEGLDTGEPPAPDIDTPDPPPTPNTTGEDPDCPPPNARRIGDVNTAQTEKVTGYELQIDKNNPDGPKICVTLWEDIGTVERYLPTVGTVTTTASIAAVATTSALLAKPIADLLLKVVKPAVKKILTKVQTMMGKSPRRPTRSEVLADRYREKRGLLPLKKK